MIVKPLATFRADFPNDCIEDDFNIVLFGGRNVAEAIRDILVAFGCTDAKLSYGGEHGWELVFAFEGHPLWLQVTQTDSYILICKDSPAGDHGTSEHPALLRVLLSLNEKLRRDGRFHDLVWYREVDFGKDRAPSDIPVIGEIPKTREMAPATEREKLTFLEKLLAPLRPRREIP